MAGATESHHSGSIEHSVDLETQKRELTEELKKSLVKGDIWYLVDCRWLKQWKKFVGFDTWDQFGVGEKLNNPGPIDNSSLFAADGTALKEHLIDELDYNLVPKDAWFKLVSWYGVISEEQALPRKVVEHGMYVKSCKVEVYLMQFKLCQHSDPKTVVTRQFSKGDTVGHVMAEMRRVFNIVDEVETRVWTKYMSNTYDLLGNLEYTVQDAGLYHGQVLILDQKNEDGTWQHQARQSTFSSSSVTSSTERSGQSSNSYSSYSSRSSWGYGGLRSSTALPGLTGLGNLGNTCFMNSALQCLSNCVPLTEYFLASKYKEELNRNNPLGMRGEIANAYAGLLNQIWNEQYSSVAPRQFKMQVGRFAPQFSGYQQQDSQELLAFLLDGLHEDLNRVKKKPYVEVKDADGRPDTVVAEESWKNHMQRNNSIIVDIFHGLFKSTLVCPDCSKVSVTFDPFCYLSLPLPVKKERSLDVFLVRSDPLIKPILYKLTVPKMGNVADLLAVLTKETNIPRDKMVVTDVYNHRFHKVFSLTESLTQILDRDDIFVYELSHSKSEADEGDFVVLPVYQREKSLLILLVGELPLSMIGNVYLKIVLVLFLFLFRRFVSVPEEDEGIGSKIEGESEADVEMNEDKNEGSENEDCEELEKATQNVHVNGDENEDDNIDSQNSDDDSSSQKNIVNNQCKGKACKYLFNLTLVNSYGRTDIQALQDNGKPLKQLTGRCFLALDWDSKVKEKCYNDQLAEESEEHESVRKKPAQKKSGIGLNDCIDLFLSKEKLGENDPWYCPSCKKHQQATKKFDLWSLPRILVVHLKRFSYNSFWRDKLDTLVNFPLRSLDMSEYVINKDQPRPIYKLIAVSNHYGGMGGGHYTAYAKNCKDGQWYSFDDSSVSRVDEEQTISKAAYVLFYQRQESEHQENIAEKETEQEQACGQDADIDMLHDGV
ncbi:ubiquitin carboxyl-terminal hydrolase 4-like [Orbicella faveolata]|uniref:ubiquitin carboxyl-terminal hydrolase 4-like n=1 Tax=Orbicella faveolata TaxID=48498 RepID=UPI0009E320CE|nr:ubiquitin carboxyl-terminal hydrolase 4-like [Orbicella faveolata]